jgi:hypothetical protein
LLNSWVLSFFPFLFHPSFLTYGMVLST